MKPRDCKGGDQDTKMLNEVVALASRPETGPGTSRTKIKRYKLSKVWVVTFCYNLFNSLIYKWFLKKCGSNSK